jgi:hypothetical protein
MTFRTIAKAALVFATLLGASSFSLHSATAKTNYWGYWSICDKQKCSKVSSEQLQEITGLSISTIKGVDHNNKGCWVRVRKGPRGFEWRSPCPL